MPLKCLHKVTHLFVLFSHTESPDSHSFKLDLLIYKSWRIFLNPKLNIDNKNDFDD